ncbi:MAG: alpha/beta fold hydrolase [Actinomycetota bacterium]|nr:alpha/beta fold hydrolase [Actinomycetota bacterium]
MVHNAYYSQEIHGAYELFELGDFPLEQGGTLSDAEIAYLTFGELNAAKDNTILVPTWYSGTHKMLTDVYVGSEHALNPERYFIVLANQLGGGLSTSPHNNEGEQAMERFPPLSVGDDVRAQEQLLRDRFGVEDLALVLGGSMGAQQVYDWAVRFPDKVKRAAPIAGTAKVTPHNAIFVESFIEAITSDPGFHDGSYSAGEEVSAGLRRTARVFSVMGFSTEFWKQEVWRALGFESADEFQTGFMNAYFGDMDPNDLVCMARKWQGGDVSRQTGGDLAAALGRIKAKTFVMPIDEDMIYPVHDCAAEQKMVPRSELRVIHSIAGHLALFGGDPGYIEQVDRHVGELLAADA